jgi:2-polyprenyl-3-methyl-5-hydroxy-6-metoxy-1,4-benzoquinol methylase
LGDGKIRERKMKEMWDDRYAGQEYFYGTKPNDFLKLSAHLLKPHSNILCMAEGEGRNAIYLASQGHHVTAVDFSETGKSKAQDLAKKRNVDINYLLSDLMDFDFGSNKWDAVVSIFCHLPQAIRYKIHSKVEHSLKTGGVFILEAYTPEQLTQNTGGPKTIDMLYTPDILKKDFSDLKWETLRNNKREVIEGIGHTGLSFVVQAIGIKK